MKKILLSTLLLAGGVLGAAAHTDLLVEDFQGSWVDNFTNLDLDRLAPHSSVNAFFMDSEGVSQPWWRLRDGQNTQNCFLGSHSYYMTPAQSQDWTTSRAITIPTTGFTLSFGAQSLPYRSGSEHALSDLWVFITEKPVTKEWQPAASEAAMHIEQVPYGNSRDLCDDDFLPYELNLDAYAGKTVYLSFANLNEDKDILCIDDVIIRRLDKAELSASAPALLMNGAYTVAATVKSTDAAGLKGWTATYKCGSTVITRTGSDLANGQSEEVAFDTTIGPDETQDWSVTLSADGMQDIIVTGQTRGMTFQTTKRVMIEEQTGTWCGNCTTFMYTLERLESDPAYGDLIIPISVHCGNDPMIVPEYQGLLGMGTNAPLARLDREPDIVGINGNIDSYYRPEESGTAAYSILQRTKNVAEADLALTLTPLMNGQSVSGIKADVEMTPAVTIDGTTYGLGFIITANNVEAADPTSGNWMQHNYATGASGDEENYFTQLPALLTGMRYHDVALGCTGMRGMEGSIPARSIAADEKVEFSTNLAMPAKPYGAKDIDVNDVYVTAYLVDMTGYDVNGFYRVVNAVRTPLTDTPNARYTLEQYWKDNSSVPGIDADTDLPAEYFDLQGRRLAEPSRGIVIVKRGATVTKEIR